jgi:hypothetical protein
MVLTRIALVVSAFALLVGCASMAPTQMVDGVAVYVRDRATVDTYCRYRIRSEDRQPHIYGCWVPADRMIMVEDGHPAVLAHELRHAQGWNHRGACHSTEADPNGRKPDGTPCEWYRGGS